MVEDSSSVPKRTRKSIRTENAIGSLIRELRIAKGWSQEDLAAAAEIDRTYVSLLERFQRDPSLSVVIQLARALDITPSAFIEAIMNRLNAI